MSVNAETRNACNWLALSLDSAIMNGVPHGILQRPTSDAFLKARIEQVDDAIASLERLLHSDDQFLLLEWVKKDCHLVRQSLIRLYAFAQLLIEEIQESVTELLQGHRACREDIQRLEVSLGLSPSFYEMRPQLSRNAISKFTDDLPAQFVDAWKALHT
jgi:hypothetical protein